MYSVSQMLNLRDTSLRQGGELVMLFPALIESVPFRVSALLHLMIIFSRLFLLDVLSEREIS